MRYRAGTNRIQKNSKSNKITIAKSTIPIIFNIMNKTESIYNLMTIYLTETP